ncbi:MAG: hypothetical protein WAO76_18500 [Georgfuchsia sp.]
MQFARTAMPLMAAVCLLSATVIGRAEDSLSPPPDGSGISERCKGNPDKCQEIKARMQARCQEHPKRCEEMKQKRQQMREECRKDPQACKQKREARREKMRQRMKEKCKQNPVKCEEWKKLNGDAAGSQAANPNP